MRVAMLAGVALAAVMPATAAFAEQPPIKSYFEFKKPRLISVPDDISTDNGGAALPNQNLGGSVTASFEGITQYDNAAFARNFIPPDTNGSVGLTQYMEVSNGAMAVFNKTTGVRQSLVSDITFWANAGQTGANGDNRVMYNAAAKRWIVMGFGANTKDLQIAVSDSDNALGGWKSVKFEGYAGFGFGATADYPTLSLDKNNVVIATNNFAPATNGGTNSFRGTTVNLIPLNSLFGAGAPTVAGIKQFNTPYNGTTQVADRGFAIQGVNSSTASTSSTLVAASLFFSDSLTYKANNVNPNSATGATLSSITYLNQAAYTTAGAARQPDAVQDTDVNGADTIVNNKRVVDTLDERISSSVYEANGRIYFVQTVNSGSDLLDEARVRITIVDSATNAIVSQYDLGSAGYDYYQGSIAVNRLGQVVIGYNRSGLSTVDGKIRFYAATFNTSADGTLDQTGMDILLKESLIDDYHNGSLFGQVANGRQRWGDYSQVNIDPSTSHGFYLIGEFAREYNNPAGGHPGGTGGSRWGTWIAGLQVGSVPEPSSWALMIGGFGFVGSALRRQRRSGFATA